MKGSSRDKEDDPRKTAHPGRSEHRGQGAPYREGDPGANSLDGRSHRIGASRRQEEKEKVTRLLAALCACGVEPVAAARRRGVYLKFSSDRPRWQRARAANPVDVYIGPPLGSNVRFAQP